MGIEQKSRGNREISGGTSGPSAVSFLHRHRMNTHLFFSLITCV